MDLPPNLQRELDYHEKLYSGFAQQHFHQPAVRAFRRSLAARILKLLKPEARVLSIGCGIGDTELLLAPHVREVTGVDLSPAGIREASEAAERAGAANALFRQVAFEEMAGGNFDAVVAIFFLHHLSDGALADFPKRLRGILAPGGVFYSLDPSRYRLSGAVGNLLFPSLMKKYQTEDERELSPGSTATLFRGEGWDAALSYYDFVSTPLAGLAPGWLAGYRAARLLDDVLVRVPGLRRVSSNFEIVARHGETGRAAGIHDFTLNSIDGRPTPLSEFKGSVVLIVNVASRCGFTPQYAGLEALYRKYRDRGFVVLGFPANNFLRQEPGSNEEIRKFCSTEYDVTFPMFSKVSVKGGDKTPLYRFLTDKRANGNTGGEIRWNFTKFLAGRDGKIIARFGPSKAPDSPEVASAIEKALG